MALFSDTVCNATWKVFFKCGDFRPPGLVNMQRFGSLIGFYADFVISLLSIYMHGGFLAILNNTNVNLGTFPLKCRRAECAMTAKLVRK